MEFLCHLVLCFVLYKFVQHRMTLVENVHNWQPPDYATKLTMDRTAVSTVDACQRHSKAKILARRSRSRSRHRSSISLPNPQFLLKDRTNDDNKDNEDEDDEFDEKFNTSSIGSRRSGKKESRRLTKMNSMNSENSNHSSNSASTTFSIATVQSELAIIDTNVNTNANTNTNTVSHPQSMGKRGRSKTTNRLFPTTHDKKNRKRNDKNGRRKNGKNKSKKKKTSKKNKNKNTNTSQTPQLNHISKTFGNDEDDDDEVPKLTELLFSASVPNFDGLDTSPRINENIINSSNSSRSIENNRNRNRNRNGKEKRPRSRTNGPNKSSKRHGNRGKRGNRNKKRHGRARHYRNHRDVIGGTPETTHTSYPFVRQGSYKIEQSVTKSVSSKNLFCDAK